MDELVGQNVFHKTHGRVRVEYESDGNTIFVVRGDGMETFVRKDDCFIDLFELNFIRKEKF